MLHRATVADYDMDDSQYGLSTREKIGRRLQVRLDYNSDSSDGGYADQIDSDSAGSKAVDKDTLSSDNDQLELCDTEDTQFDNERGGSSSPIAAGNSRFDATIPDQVRMTGFHNDEHDDSDLSGSGSVVDGEWDSRMGEHDPLLVTDISVLANARRAQQERLNKLDRSDPEKLLSVILSEIIAMLDPAESPMEAFTRFAPIQNKTKNKSIVIDADASAKKKAAFQLTGLCNMLTNSHNIANAYELSREQFMRLYKQETRFEYKRGVKRTADSSDHPDESSTHANSIDYGEKIWEFRWFGDDEIHGPFSDYEMAHWKVSYFDGNVEVRKTPDLKFLDITDVEFDTKI